MAWIIIPFGVVHLNGHFNLLLKKKFYFSLQPKFYRNMKKLLPLN
jgi:hypothetical protein